MPKKKKSPSRSAKAQPATAIKPSSRLKPKTKAKPKSLPVKKPSSVRDELGRIKPGHSLNPGGRTSGSRSVLPEIREQIFQALEECQREGKPLSQLLSRWMLSADAKEGANLMRAIAAFMPKEMNLDIEAKFSDMSDEALEARIASFVKNPEINTLLRSVK
ncbi:MAG: hypothetical protein OEZ32_08095 [Nitrospinota bacterium]|nr:hypothetical protein [Nitrospinota bacterium]